MMEVKDTDSKHESTSANTQPVQEPVCLYHTKSWRSHIEYILSLLKYGDKQDFVYFPQKYQNKVKSMLCICDEKNKRDHSDWVIKNENHIKDVLEVFELQEYLDLKITKFTAFEQFQALVNLQKKKRLLHFDALLSSNIGSLAFLRFLHRIFSREFNLLSQTKNDKKMEETLPTLQSIIFEGIQKDKEHLDYLDVHKTGWPELPKSVFQEEAMAGTQVSWTKKIKFQGKRKVVCEEKNISSKESVSGNEAVTLEDVSSLSLKENDQKKVLKNVQKIEVWKSAANTEVQQPPSTALPENVELSTKDRKLSNPIKIETSHAHIPSHASDGVKGGGVCLYHHKYWRPKLENLLNVLRNTEKSTKGTDVSIPHKYVYRVNKIICCCDNQKGLKWVEWVKENEAEIKKKILDKFCNSKNKTPEIKIVITFLNELENSNLLNVKDPRSSNTGALLFWVLLYKIISRDFSEMELPPQNKAGGNTATDLSINVKLEGFPDKYISFLIGRRGHNIRSVEFPFYCKIKIYTVTESNDTFSVWANITKITQKASKNKNQTPPRTFEEIIQMLNIRTKRIIERRTAHEQSVKAFEKTRGRRFKNWAEQLRRRNPFLETNLIPSNASNIKYVNAENYNRKHKVEYKKTKKDCVLIGSRCLYCLGPYDKKATQSDACIYHPGFIEKKYWYDKCGMKNVELTSIWSCCGEPCLESHATFELHQGTGCKKGHHNWRPTGQDARGGKIGEKGKK